MTYTEALKEARRRREIAQMTHETSALEYLNAVVNSLSKSAQNELITLATGVNEKGQMTIYEIPKKEDSIYGRLLNCVSDFYRRLGIRYTDYISQYFTSNEERFCKSCYHRAEFIVHGFLCGLAGAAVVLMILEWLVIHR